MAATVDPLVVGRVIGDVVDMFVPSVSLSVYYGSKHVTNGCNIKPSFAANPPRVVIPGHSDKLFTLVMTDPDAPSPSEPSMREWVHWIVTDIPGNTSPTREYCFTDSLCCKITNSCFYHSFTKIRSLRGKEILAYMGPRPPVGIHRYILVLFHQKEAVGQVEAPASRSNFNTRAFAQQLDLGLPVATVYFNAQKEPANKRR